MDILRVISASDLEVRRKTLDLAMDLVSSRNVEEVIEISSKVVYFRVKQAEQQS